MDSEIIITALVFLCMVVAIFILLGRSGSGQKKKLLLLLKQTAAAEQSVITTYDTWNNAAIGIDHATNKIFAVYTANEQLIPIQVNLTGLKDCLVKKTSKPLQTGDEKYAAVEKLNLVFISKESRQADAIIPFYDADNDSMHLNGELDLVEKWRKLVCEKIHCPK